MRALLRDPLAHFLLAGMAIWGVLALAGDTVDQSERQITLSREQQAGLALGFERMMGRPPTDAELEARIQQWVREEVLYREALRLGLDQGDPVVRRRLAAKMDELSGAQVELAQPSEETLRAWYDDNRAVYEAGSTLTFKQAWFASEIAARAGLDDDAPSGEPISLPRLMTDADLQEVRRVFGEDFAAQLSELEPGAGWQGPVQSGFGWHLVSLSERQPGRLPPFEDISEAVERDWRSQTIETRRNKAFELLREAYTIDIE